MIFADLNEFVYFVPGGGKLYAAGKAPDGSPYQVVILRVSYSNYHVDTHFVDNLKEARAAGLLVHFYFYLEAGVDPASQGAFFAHTLLANGGLQPGEGIWCDCEEGTGNLEPNVQTALAAAHAVLNDPTVDEGEYSGASFFTVHLGTTPAGMHRWIADYGAPEPALGEEFFQFTDNRVMPGVSAPCDCSIYNGTLAQLKAAFSPPPAPQPVSGTGTTPTPAPPAPAKETTVITAHYDNQLHTFTVAPNGDLLHRWQPDNQTNWGGPEVVGTGFVYPQTPGVDTVHNGNLNVFVDRADGSQVHYWQGPGGPWGSETLAP